MQSYPTLPKLADAPPELLASGHLWLREYVAGERLRFQMAESGLLRFGGRERVFDEVPPPVAAGVRHVRERFDRDAFAGAVADPAEFVFFGVAPCDAGVDYDWERIPPFLGWSVWSDRKQRRLPVDAAERIFERLGLDPLNTFRKEVHVRDFHPDRYELPESAWYDGPAAGVVVENRRGGSALLENPAVGRDDGAEPLAGDPPAIADALVTDGRLGRAVEAVESRGGDVSVSEVHPRVFELIAREEYGSLDAGNVEWGALRSAVGSVVASELRRVTDT